MSFGLRFLWHPVNKADGPRWTFTSPPDILVHGTIPLRKQLTNEDGKKDGATMKMTSEEAVFVRDTAGGRSVFILSLTRLRCTRRVKELNKILL
jgi:hypothetical protein